jgi:hypothetical protein
MCKKTHLLEFLLAIILLSLFLVLPGLTAERTLTLDERPAEPGEWGYCPADGSASQINPPSFSWRPQKNLTWEIECARDTQFKDLEYQATNIEFTVHCPPRSFEPGTYQWRYRGKDEKDGYTNWSKPRKFTIARDAVVMPLPGRDELIARIPKTHPRLFMRPENLGRLRESAHGKMKAEYDKLVKQCESILANPPPTDEPPKYPDGMIRSSDQWSKIWWGNREYTIRALNSAATLAFTHLLGGQERYGLEAKRILLECAKWDPKGSTGYQYNDEAGMPYAYYFARTYTFVNDLLSEEEKKICRDVMKIRGDEMYQHLCPRHFWRPFASHSNRAWHFLGEVGIAFLDEIEGADDWVWFATNVFFNVYPVWSDDDGGWHEGSSYWYSYLNRFTWWADVMREAMGINAYDKPFFSQVGYYAMYLMPPGMADGGFGDLTANRTAKSNVPLMSIFAAQAQNGYWQWYVEQFGGPTTSEGYIGFIRGGLPKVKAKPPDNLPTSRLFAGTGQAFLNSNITDAGDSVQVVFKSSPFGTQSHGYEANNSFLLWAYGKRLLIRSGRRDIYGSDHHKNWMWSTRSVNSITVNSSGQISHSAKAQGKITSFKTTPSIDIVVGEAGQAYDPPLERFTRAIIFVKPELVIVYDRLKAKEASSYEYWLHAINKINVEDQHNIQVKNDAVVCDIDFLTPMDLTFKQTDQYDPNPRPRIKLRQWHLTAKTPEKKTQIEFVTLYRPHRVETKLPKGSHLEKIDGGYALDVELTDGQFIAILPIDERASLQAHGLQSKGAIICKLKQPDQSDQIVEVQENDKH